MTKGATTSMIFTLPQWQTERQQNSSAQVSFCVVLKLSARFIKALKAKVQKSTLEQIQPLNVIKGGDEPGVWGVELLAIRYAAWIKPEFEIEVYEVFRTVVRLGISAMSRLNKIDHIINTETKQISQCASQMARWGSGGRKQLLNAARNRVADEVQMYLPGIM